MAAFGLGLLLMVGLLGQPAHGIRGSSSLGPGPGLHDGSSEDGPSFTASKDLTTPQFLIISSPSLSKVVWTTLQNMESAEGRTFALIDFGLKQPKGLAFDHKRGFLYIADSGAEKIFRYTVIIENGEKPTLSTTHLRLVVAQGCGPVEWVTVDDAGNLFYSAPRSNNINKISTQVMSKLASGEIQASALTVISEKSMEADQTAANVMALTSAGDALPTDPPPVRPHILSIYEAALNPHVAHPAAIYADGPDLYWANQQEGATAGTIVKGQVNPTVAKRHASKEPSNNAPAPFPAVALTNASTGARALAKTDKMMFFTQNGTSPGSSIVSTLILGTNIVIDVETSLAGPRSMAWDTEDTIYVADEVGDQVFSFPTGRAMNNAPLTLAVSVKGPHGLAIMSSADPCFSVNRVGAKGAFSGVRENSEEDDEESNDKDKKEGNDKADEGSSDNDTTPSEKDTKASASFLDWRSKRNATSAPDRSSANRGHVFASMIGAAVAMTGQLAIPA